MNEEIRKIVEGRLGMYSFLSAVLLDAPPKEFLKDLMEGLIEFPKQKEIEEGAEILKNLAKEFSNVDDFERFVRQEYTAVFIGPYSYHASPYQSSYEGDSPYGKVTLRIKEKYIEFGYKYSYSEPADHIGVELAFMAESCKELLKGNLEEIKKQREFIKELEKWVFRFCDEVENHPEARFYKGIAKILRGFVKLDRSIMNFIGAMATMS
jgi:TorA maturation chaperone TorD